jgi:hypothetical protein
MLEKIKNWIIKVLDEHKDNLESEKYNLSPDKFAKLIFTDILITIPKVMLSKYNTISIQFKNTRKNEFMIVLFCNIYGNDHNSKLQKERKGKEDYKWDLDCIIDKNNFGSSCQQLITVRNILKNLTKEETHYSQNEIDKLMKKAKELDRKTIKEDVNNS